MRKQEKNVGKKMEKWGEVNINAMKEKMERRSRGN
jgi:hypothetical protein